MNHVQKELRTNFVPSYINRLLSTAAANVLRKGVNRVQKTLFMQFRAPIQKGKWERAFALDENRSVGFSLKGTPFGLDGFDMYPLRGSKLDFRFQDFFTGLVFDKTYEQLQSIDYPYQRFAKESDYRQKHNPADTAVISRMHHYYSNEADDVDVERWKVSVSLLGFIELMSMLLASVVGFVVATYWMVKRIYT